MMRLVNDYMDETRTILITTHQVEEVENLLTDVLFIEKGRNRTRFIARRHRDSIRGGGGGPPIESTRARAEKPFYERRMLGKLVLYFRTSRSGQARAVGRGAYAQRRGFVRRQAVRRCRMNTTMNATMECHHEHHGLADPPGILGKTARSG